MTLDLRARTSRTRGVHSLSIAITLLLLIGVGAFVLFNIGDLKQFIALVLRTHFGWLLVAGLIQVATYIFTGLGWIVVARASYYTLRVKKASLMALEQLAVDQLVPAVGIAGNTLIARSMTKLGMPAQLAMEVMLVNILAYHAAYMVLVGTALAILSDLGRLTPLIVSVIGIYTVVALIVVSFTLMVAYSKTERLPVWLTRRELIAKFLELINNVSAKRVLSPVILLEATGLKIFVFLLDALTLYVVMISFGASVTFTVALVALTIGSIAGLASPIPGGVGGYEIGSVATLSLLGVPIEAALAGTIILRGLTLWLPLVPGAYLLRHQIPNGSN